MLYQIDQTGDALDAIAEAFWEEQQVAPEVRGFAERLVRGVVEGRAELDLRISNCSERWRLDRMAVVDRNILRLAAFEMSELDGEPVTPAAVVIDEAIEIAKRFSSAESARFINGVLDELRLRGEAAR